MPTDPTQNSYSLPVSNSIATITYFGRKSRSTISTFYVVTLSILVKSDFVQRDSSLLTAITKTNGWAHVGNEQTGILIGSPGRDITTSGLTLNKRSNVHLCIWVMYRGLQQK